MVGIDYCGIRTLESSALNPGSHRSRTSHVYISAHRGRAEGAQAAVPVSRRLTHSCPLQKAHTRLPSLGNPPGPRAGGNNDAGPQVQSLSLRPHAAQDSGQHPERRPDSDVGAASKLMGNGPLFTIDMTGIITCLQNGGGLLGRGLRFKQRHLAPYLPW